MMEFRRYHLSHTENLFPALQNSVQWENFSKGRQIAVLHRPENDSIPLVRTTTVYKTPSQPFVSIHQDIIDKIKEASGMEDLDFNNAMLEIYDSRYTTMGFHTDQALDLDPNSYICLFSSYEKGADSYPRILSIKNKESEEEFDVQLLHHSVVIFSTATNQRHAHKIIGKDLPKNYDNRWMGFTLRLSKTFVKFVNDIPFLMTGEMDLGELTLATEKECKAFYAYKGLENRGTSYEWPKIRYTISPSDRMAHSS